MLNDNLYLIIVCLLKLDFLEWHLKLQCLSVLKHAVITFYYLYYYTFPELLFSYTAISD